MTALRVGPSFSPVLHGLRCSSKSGSYRHFERNLLSLSSPRICYKLSGARPGILFGKIRSSSQKDVRAEIADSEKDKNISVVLLAGGTGKNMGTSMPKQYLPLLGQPIALYSFFTFSDMAEVKEIVVVCDPFYNDVFEDVSEELGVNIKFALPGMKRQDSVFSGLQEVDEDSELVCIHDSVRPLINFKDIEKVFKDAWLTGASVLGVPVKAPLKEVNSDSFVIKTLDRAKLWEIQTPQVMKLQLLKDGFDLVHRKGLVVTDDASIVEHLRHPIHIIEGSCTNIKVTTTYDLLIAERLLSIDADD